ncbi:MAG: hypothetical protein R2932_39440 [Caldilineaceae bacterium]
MTQTVSLQRLRYDLPMAVQAILKSGMPREIALLIEHGIRRIEHLPGWQPLIS